MPRRNDDYALCGCRPRFFTLLFHRLPQAGGEREERGLVVSAFLVQNHWLYRGKLGSGLIKNPVSLLQSRLLEQFTLQSWATQMSSPAARSSRTALVSVHIHGCCGAQTFAEQGGTGLPSSCAIRSSDQSSTTALSLSTSLARIVHRRKVARRASEGPQGT